jgi:hypothetical protein
MHVISRTAALLAGAVLGVSAIAATSSASAGDGDVARSDLLRAPVQGSLTDDPMLFGLAPGGAPWVISEGRARLRADGTLRVEVEGLVIPDRGNPLPTLSATVVCNGKDRMMTGAVPFSPAGDARINTRVTLPERCLAPAVLLNPLSNGGVYIAATGR